MRLILTLRGENPVSLPLANNHSVQGMLYAALAKSGDAAALHDEGWRSGEKVFRLFTFGPLKGTYTIMSGRITFPGEFMLEVRSVDNGFIQCLAVAFGSDGWAALDGQKLVIVSAQALLDVPVGENRRIRMLSPIVLYKTQQDGRTQYVSPEDSDFGNLANTNFRAKYRAYTGAPHDGGIMLRPLRVSASDKLVTRYKGFYITGWHGIYELSGKPEHTSFLYSVGLGGKNAQGFGMFEPL